MTISSEVSKIIYEGNGSTDSFAVPFQFGHVSDLDVVVRGLDGNETTLELTTDYRVDTSEGTTGGTLVATSPPVEGTVLTIRRDPGMLQETVYEEGVPLSAKARESALDLLTTLVQANRERIDRAVALKVTSQAENIELPDPEAGRALVWNAAGDNLDNGPTASEIQAAQGSAETATTARDEAVAARDIAVAAAGSVDLPDMPQGGQIMRYDMASSAWVAVEPSEVMDFSPIVRSQNRGFAEVAAQLAMPDISFDNRRLDTFEDASNIGPSSTGYTLDGANDLVKPMPGAASQVLDLSAATHADVKGAIATLTVDTANTSGHFDAAVPGAVLAGCRMVIGGTDYIITAITNDGTGTDEVEFSGTLATGAQAVSAIHGTVYEGAALKLSELITPGTTNVSTGGTAVASSTNNGSASAVIDGSFGTFWQSTTVPASIEIDPATTDYAVNKYAIARRSDNTYWPTAWTFEGYNGSTWEVLDTRSGQSPSTASTLYSYEIDNTVAYEKYRLNCSATNGSTFAELSQFILYEAGIAIPSGQFYVVTLPGVDQSVIADVDSLAVTDNPGGETLVYAASFDGGSTVKAWDGSVWQTVTLTSSTGWMTEATVEGIADSDWETLTGDLVLFAGLQSSSAANNPELSSATWSVEGQTAAMSLVMSPVPTTASPVAGATWLAVGAGQTPPTVELSRDGGVSWDEVSLTSRGEFMGTMDTYDGEVATFTHAAGVDMEIIARLSTSGGSSVDTHFLSVGADV